MEFWGKLQNYDSHKLWWKSEENHKNYELRWGNTKFTIVTKIRMDIRGESQKSQIMVDVWGDLRKSGRFTQTTSRHGTAPLTHNLHWDFPATLLFDLPIQSYDIHSVLWFSRQFALASSNTIYDTESMWCSRHTSLSSFKTIIRRTKRLLRVVLDTLLFHHSTRSHIGQRVVSHVPL